MGASQQLLASIRPIEAGGLSYVGGYLQTNGTAAGWTATLGSLSGGSDSSPSEGDIVIVAYTICASSDQTPAVTTSGYTSLGQLYQNDDKDCCFSVSYKIMGPSPDASVDLSAVSFNGFGQIVAIHVWRGVDTSTPMDVAAATAGSGNSAIANPPAITPVTTGAVIVVAGANARDNGDIAFTSGADNFITTGFDNSTFDATIGMGSYEWNGSGVYDPPAFGFSSNSTRYSRNAFTLALRPA